MNDIAYPQHSNWEERSDLVYGPALRKALLILDKDQQTEIDQVERTPSKPSHQGSRETGDLYQRTTSRRLNRYKLLKSNIVSECEHTIKAKNGSVLRKSTVAVKPKKTLTEKLASAKKGVTRSPKSKLSKTVKSKPAMIAESSDSSDHQPLHSLPVRLPVEIEAREEAIAAWQGTSGTMTHEERELE